MSWMKPILGWQRTERFTSSSSSRDEVMCCTAVCLACSCPPMTCYISI
uniref:Uncharacterized protein n=1 Tax=Setaria italica TaxID=4555 RepID=K4A411_SETIT